jgi:hypothetical protein
MRLIYYRKRKRIATVHKPHFRERMKVFVPVTHQLTYPLVLVRHWHEHKPASFEVLTAITVNVMSCSLVVHRRFGGTYCINLQGRRVSQANNAHFLLLCFLDYSSTMKMEACTFLRNVARRLSDYMVWRPRIHHSSTNWFVCRPFNGDESRERLFSCEFDNWMNCKWRESK